MYKVNSTLSDAYGDLDMKPKSGGPDMPHCTVGNRRMTNVSVGGGEYIRGIRKNDGLNQNEPLVAGDLNGMEHISSQYDMGPIRPLRYTPGLKCDAHLESLRPTRDPRNPPIQGGDQWKKKLVQVPTTYDGSFADADMQKFRPSPNLSPMEDPWYASRLPDLAVPTYDRLASPYYGEMGGGPYNQVYPQDELSMIKMRNRRFQNGAAQDMMSLNHPAAAYGYGPFPPQGGFGYPPMYQPMMMMPRGMPMGPMPMGPPMQQQMFDYEMAQDELSRIDQDLNTTRRVNRPYLPVNAPNYWNLQKQINEMEQESYNSYKPKQRNNEITSIEQLPSPKPVIRAPLTEAAATKSVRPEVKVADQIAIRSFVIGQNLGRVGGGSKQEASSE